MTSKHAVAAILAIATTVGLSSQVAGQPRLTDWTIHFDEPHAVTTTSSIPFTAIELSDGRLMTIGNALYRLNVDTGAGAFLSIRPPANYDNVLAMAGGDLLTWTPSGGCTIRKIGSDGRIRWTVSDTRHHCLKVVTTESGMIAVLWRSPIDGSAWLTGLTPRGVQAWRTDPIADARLPSLVSDASAPVFYLVAKRGTVDSPRYEPGQVTIHAFDTNGALRWDWTSSDLHQTANADADPAGGVLVDAGPLGGPESPPTRILGFDATGQKRSDFSLVVESWRWVLPAPQHDAYIVDEVQGVPRVRRFAEDGALVWAWSVDGAQFPGTTTAGAQADRAGAVILNFGASVARVAPGGDLAFQTENLDFPRYIQEVIELADGRLFALTQGDNFVAGIDAIQADGTVTALTAIPEMPLPAYARPRLWIHAGNNGAGAFLTPHVDDTQSELRAIAADGRPAWSRVPGYASYCDGDWLCVPEQTYLAELNADTGVERWRWTRPKRRNDERDSHSYFRRVDGGISSLDFQVCGGSFDCMYLSQVTQLAPGGGAFPASLPVDGRALAVSNVGTVLSIDGAVFRLARANGSTARFTYDYLTTIVTRPESYRRPFPLPAALHADESATIVTAPCAGNLPTPCTRGIEITRLDAAGTRWSVETGISDEWLPGLGSQQLLENADGSVVVLLGFTDLRQASQGTYRLHLTNLAPDGRVLWTRDWTQSGLGINSAELFPVPGKNAIALVWSRKGTTNPSVTAVNLATGVIRSEHELECAGVDCDVWSVDIGTGGTLVASGLTEQTSTIIGRHGLMETPVRVPLQAAGLAGAWYAPRSSGQGFTIRTYPGSSTVFMPWFTFESIGKNDVDSQRWYVLQGDYAPGADAMSMAIIERSGGIFDQAPADPLSIVGEARFSLQSCERALLDFRFTAGRNQGAAGVIALQSLLPPRYPCTDDQGATRPAEAGYDNALTGSWYDPATNGQGLEIERIAPGAGSGGLLYAAWFTFAPAAVSGGANDQRWFTLQGQEAGADGAVRTTIVQTIGGRFDADPTANIFRVGSAELVPQGCDRMTLRYTFDDTIDAGEFRGLAGEIPLQRIGACPAN